MIVKSSKLSDFKIKKLVWCFCVDVEANKVSLIVGLNRTTINRFYKIFRTLIYYHQQEEFKRTITGEAECDEAYFGAKRLKGVPGKRGRGTHKQPVFGIYERDGRVYTGMMDWLMLDMISIKESITQKHFPMETERILTVLKTFGVSLKEDLQSSEELR